MSIKENVPMVDNDRDLCDLLKTEDRVIALFYASWCPFCVRILPLFKTCAEEGRGVFLLVADDGETMADQYHVKVYPTVIYFEKGVISRRLDGALGMGLQEKQITDFIKACS